MKKNKAFAQEDLAAFEPEAKVGLLVTINTEGLPHLTLITSLQARDTETLLFGQFAEGRSKKHVTTSPQTGFLIMTLDRKLWRGKARWTHKRTDGPEYEIYNDIPMFRYNAYFGINTVHYLDLVETYGEEKLPMAKILPAAMTTRLAKGAAATPSDERILKPFAENLFNQLDALKFIAYVGEDGFPIIIPAIQCQASDSRRIVFSALPFYDELQAIQAGTCVAIMAINLKMQSVLVRGTFQGFHKYRFTTMGVLDIEWVYNSMPPSHGQIYPEVPLDAVTDF